MADSEYNINSRRKKWIIHSFARKLVSSISLWISFWISDRDSVFNFTLNFRSSSRIQFSFTIFFANSLRILFNFREFTFDSRFLSRIHFEFTIFSRINLKLTIFYSNPHWIHYHFSRIYIEFTISFSNLLSCFPIDGFTLNSLSSFRFTFNSLPFARIHFGFNFQLTIYFANSLSLSANSHWIYYIFLEFKLNPQSIFANSH